MTKKGGGFLSLTHKTKYQCGVNWPHNPRCFFAVRQPPRFRKALPLTEFSLLKVTHAPALLQTPMCYKSLNLKAARPGAIVLDIKKFP
jgi:hypothetical protein